MLQSPLVATADDSVAWRWIALTIVLCGLVGFVPLDQALYRLGMSPTARSAFRWQLASMLVWLAIAPWMTRRWSLAESELRALGGVSALAVVTAFINAVLIFAMLRPPSTQSRAVSWIELTLAMVPIHLLTVGLITLVGSWTSARRHRQRSADREALLSANAVRAELDALRTRLQPHFLLNALNTVAGLARQHQGERAADVAGDLGELLRFSLAESGDAVAFDAEREIVERYLAIEQARLGDRLIVHWSIDRALRTTRIPALMWQPLVENAIRHGIARLEQPGVLRLSATRFPQHMLLVVDADGPPPTASDRTPLDQFGGMGIGLSTVERRLHLLFGDAARVTLQQRDGGSVTTLQMPCTTT